ncbi:hypothetical protein FH972_025880 [Carpinus fangiana]|uniref:Uncharacterized protein n=1 Tax=Carpinus fangiana TaxID=176857 RepID=A0A5N6L2V2_9ROSI|nr:hypothetical protein FH972_025880 [Carpinus fangiana]
MGFTTGLVLLPNPHLSSHFHANTIWSQLGGITLTTGTLYLTLHLHRQNRLYQATLLRQQSMLLNNIVDPPLPGPPPVDREVRAGRGCSPSQLEESTELEQRGKGLIMDYVFEMIIARMGGLEYWPFQGPPLLRACLA